MAFEYPQVISFDITDDDGDISLKQSGYTQQAYNWSNERGSSGVVYVAAPPVTVVVNQTHYFCYIAEKIME